jgi:hypothetical protein
MGDARNRTAPAIARDRLTEDRSINQGVPPERQTCGRRAFHNCQNLRVPGWTLFELCQ